MSALTVGRAIAARRFVEHLAGVGRLPSRAALDDVPISQVETLQRIEKFEPSQVDRLLPQVMSGGATNSRLAAVEDGLRRAATQRADLSPDMSAFMGMRTGHRRRMLAKSFRAAALEILSSPTSPLAGELILSRSSDAGAPVPCDAIVRRRDGEQLTEAAVAIRADTNSRTIRKRVQEAAWHAMAGARFFETFWVVHERADEARQMADMLQEIDVGTGVGVMLMHRGGALTILYEARRTRPPDLGQR